MHDLKEFGNSIIMLPLWERMLIDNKKGESSKKKKTKNIHVPLWYDVIITANKNYSKGLEEAHKTIESIIKGLTKDQDGVEVSPFLTPQHLYARLQAQTILALVKEQQTKQKFEDRSIYQVWPDFEVSAFLNKSVNTISGKDADGKPFRFSVEKNDEIITWAVLDSGIDSAINPQKIFLINRVINRGIEEVLKDPRKKYNLRIHLKILGDLINKDVEFYNLNLNEEISAVKDILDYNNIDHNLLYRLNSRNMGHRHFFGGTMHPKLAYHRDFTIHGSQNAYQEKEAPFKDESGHGTHVAGIITGNANNVNIGNNNDGAGIFCGPFNTYRDELSYGKASDDIRIDQEPDSILRKEDMTNISGVAPICWLVSIKIMSGNGNSGTTRSVLAAITHIMKINKENPNDRIHGVNLSAGYTFNRTWYGCGHTPLCVAIDELVKSGVVVVVAAGNEGNAMSIKDPGNANLVITVGSTHREHPEKYGITYTSSKGPTTDGRVKPDLVAPGEKIVSCAAGEKKANIEKRLMKLLPTGSPRPQVDYIEQSGTSMAAPHVSGAIAAFLSKRPEFIGNPLEVKEIFMKTATDLKRDIYMQGAGLVNLRKAIAYKKRVVVKKG
jgi:subtilisin family serine protease